MQKTDNNEADMQQKRQRYVEYLKKKIELVKSEIKVLSVVAKYVSRPNK